MGITHVDKTLSAATIGCDGTLNVTLSVTAKPDITEEPVDIALVLDRSGSMAGSAMMHMKQGAKEFIDIVAGRTGGMEGSLGESRIGIVSFAATAGIDMQLSADTAALKAAVDALTAGGNTNHADAFGQASALLGTSGGRKRVLVMFTDGETTVGPNPAPIAAAVRATGVEIYCIGLVGTTGLNEQTLHAWASEPTGEHVVTTPSEEELEEMFERMADEVAAPGATDVHIRDTVSADFVITGFTPPAVGEASLTGSQELHWKIGTLADTAEETATITFGVRHVAGTGGSKKVNAGVELTDSAGSAVAFPSPSVTVECGSIVDPCCPEPIDICVDACQDAIACDVGDIVMTAQGRLLQLDLTLKNICPGRRTAVGILVTECTAGGEESRGFKAITVPAHEGAACRDVHVYCIPFVLPDDPDGCGCGKGLCARRRLRIRVIAHPMDCGWNCCGNISVR